MNAEQILEHLKANYPEAAIIPELRIDDPVALEIKTPPYYRRCDALMFDGAQRTIFEFKVDKADVDREVEAKQRVWEPYVHRVVYAVPAGLIDHPPFHWRGHGLIWVHENGRIEWKMKCRVNQYPEPLPQKVIFNIAYRAAHGTARTFK